jgi:hypothetical protein
MEGAQMNGTPYFHAPGTGKRLALEFLDAVFLIAGIVGAVGARRSFLIAVTLPFVALAAASAMVALFLLMLR